MHFEEFARKLQADLEQRTEGLAKVSRVSFLHNNGTESPSLCVRFHGRNAAPGLNLKNLFEYYQSGISWDCLIAETLKMLRSDTDFHFLKEDFFLWENIRGRIRPLLVSRERNSRRRQECPHRDFLDLLLLYAIFWTDDTGLEALAIIRTGHMESWGITEEELHRTAMENTLHEEKFFCASMEDVTKEILTGEPAPGGLFPSAQNITAYESDTLMLYVLSNSSRRWGSRLLLFPDWMAEQCQRRGWKYLYVLPSSVHEVIALRMELAPPPTELKALIAAVNEECLSAEEYLSDSLYIFDAEKKKLRIWEDDTSS